VSDEAGCIAVTPLIEVAAGLNLGTEGPTLIVTDRDLAMPGCASLFGYADRARRIAVISTNRLDDLVGTEQLRSRVHNAIAHEWGHLRGLSHCRSARCVMRPAREPEDLDRRPETLCPRCAGGGWAARIRRSVAACLFLGSIVATLNVVPDYLIGPPPEMPFTCAALDPSGVFSRTAMGPEDHAHIYFQGRELFELIDKAGHASIRARSLPFAERLNALWRSDSSTELRVVRASAGVARIYAGDEAIFDVLAGDVRAGDLMETARKWTTSLNEAFRVKQDVSR
jgi:hypothetical protein